MVCHVPGLLQLSTDDGESSPLRRLVRSRRCRHWIADRGHRPGLTRLPALGRTVARSRRGTVEHAGGGGFVCRVGRRVLYVTRRHRSDRGPPPVGRRPRAALDLIPGPCPRDWAGRTAGGGG